MDYRCPKCQTDLRFKFKGVFRLSCPNCRVSLYRTTSSAEIKLGVNLEYMLALAGFVIAALALFLVGPTPYFWLLFVIGLACAAAAFIHLANRRTADSWPRWTDKAPR